MRIIYPPLGNEIRNLYENSFSEFVIITPWIKEEALNFIMNPDREVNYRVLIMGKVKDIIFGSTDISAIEKLLGLGAEIKLVENLHAKIYVRDNCEAIITSANLTPSGFEKNVEIGVCLNETEEIRGLINQINSWFDMAKPLDEKWLEKAKALIKSNAESIQNLQKIEKEIIRSSSDLRGARIMLSNKSRRRNILPKNFETEIRNWVRKKSKSSECTKENIENEVIKLVRNLIKELPDKTFKKTWFGVHSDRISLTIGNIWLGSIWTRPPRDFRLDYKRTIWILVDDSWDFLAKSTEHHSPLGWKIFPWNKIAEINSSKKIWDSYRRASEKVLMSPISSTIIRKNIKNKIKLDEIYR